MRWVLGVVLLLVVGMVAYAVLARSEIDRLTVMCESISPGAAVPKVLARLSEAGDFRLHGPVASGSGGAPKQWFFTSHRYPMIFPYASCHIDEASGTVTSVRVFLD